MVKVPKIHMCEICRLGGVTWNLIRHEKRRVHISCLLEERGVGVFDELRLWALTEPKMRNAAIERGWDVLLDEAIKRERERLRQVDEAKARKRELLRRIYRGGGR